MVTPQMLHLSAKYQASWIFSKEFSWPYLRDHLKFRLKARAWQTVIIIALCSGITPFLKDLVQFVISILTIIHHIGVVRV